MPSVNEILSKNVLRTIGLISIYYPFSIGITFYQKWFVKQEFTFPLFVVLCHYILKFLFANVCRTFYDRCRRGDDGGKRWVRLSWRDYVIKLAAVGFAASIDIGLSNWSFEFITVSLYTMAKSSSIIFILFFAVLLSLEKCRMLTLSTVSFIALGLFLFTFRSTQFNVVGFLLVELATLCAGLRWTCSQLLMQKSKHGLHHPLDMIYHVQPWMILGILPLVFGFEGRSLADAAVVHVGRGFSPVGRTIGLIVVGAVIAFLMEIAEYALVVYTSSLTLNVCGIAKEIITLVLAHYYKGDQFSTTNLVGLCLCVTGVSLHVYTRSRPESTSNEEPDLGDDQLRLIENEGCDHMGDSEAQL